MHLEKKYLLRSFALLVMVLALGLAGCAGPRYTAAPPSESLVYMDMKFKKGYYGGAWFGPSYQAPRLTVAPTLPNGE
ncbi:MAG: hypothetical protein SynsKO_14110 [Synoicihabitans sp.]